MGKVSAFGITKYLWLIYATNETKAHTVIFKQEIILYHLYKAEERHDHLLKLSPICCQLIVVQTEDV